MSSDGGRSAGSEIMALLGPTNTGKTHRAIEQMLSHRSGMIGLPLRLLAREVYDRITAQVGEAPVALVTGEEKRVPAHPRYFVCTVESMPVDHEVDFVAVDEIQLASHRQRGHTFTDRMLHARGREETWFLGSDSMIPIVEDLLPTATIRRHPRFSSLSYVGAAGISALPPRSAVVGFSVADVYDLAERVRARHGGTAVVLGALSPRTRNAQVAMYESGDVDYMVATDAIGMGLNLDLDRVYFSGLQKFDGHETRSLDVTEMAQIAGRAGRYTRDGGFGTVRPLDGLDARDVAAIEQHRFPAARAVVWRNSDLDFSSIDALIASLKVRSPRPMLRLVERADDFEVLVALSRRNDIRRRATSPAEVELLWEVCRIPDFRKLLTDSHEQLLAHVFLQLSGPGERIDESWMSRRIDRLRDVAGDIETLMNRIAFIRTWTYITHHERWIARAEHWQTVTREIEDQQSDALHERLTERFVERRSGRRSHLGVDPAKGGRRRGRAIDPAHPFSALAELALSEEDTVTGSSAWVDEVVEAPHAAFEIDELGRVTMGGTAIARLRRGPDPLHPEVALVPDGLSGAATRLLARRLVAWAKDAVAGLLGPVGVEVSSAPVRGVLYALQQGLGTVDGAGSPSAIARLSASDRELLEQAGVRVERSVAYLPHALRHDALRLRWALTRAFYGVDLELPRRGAVSLSLHDAIDPAVYPLVGYVVRGPRAIRADVLGKIEQRLHEQAREGSPFTLPADLGSSLGARRGELRAVVRAMGFRQGPGDGWRLGA